MMPIYMDSYPHLRSQVPYGQCYYPCYDGIPPQMTVDQARYPMMYGPCSNGSNPGHMIPCYACCYHVNVPVYCSFNPLTSHLTSSPFLHSCGHHPVFTAPSHVNYQFTPHHSAVQRRYEYDKEAQRDYHCSGCPNHICNQKSGGVNIEEQDPEIVRKNDSLVPISTKNYPYPVMWIPPEYIKKIYEKGRPLESEVGDQKNAPRNTESHEDTKSPEKGTRVWNGWFPLDLNSLKPLMHEEDKERIDNCLTEDKLRQFPHPIIWMPSNDGKEDAQKDQKKMNGWFPIDISGLKSLMKDEVEKGKQNQQVEDKRRQFPYPIIWIPSHSEQGQADKEDQRDSNVALKAEEPLSSFKVIPVETSEIEDDSLNKSENRNNVGNQAKSTQTMDNIANQRLNSAKRVEVQKKEDSCNETRKVSDDTSKYSETVATDSPTRAILSKQLSPQKTSKLPPVCLRVEPLLKKKNGSCSSRSPSPPGSNKGSLEKAKEPSLSSASSSLKENTQQEIQTQDCFMNKSEKVEPAEMERKVVHLADDRNCENKNEDWRTGSQRKKPMRLHIDSEEDTFNKSSTKGTERDTDKFEDDERVRDGRDMVGEMATKNKICHSAEVADGEGVRKIKNLSDMEAAKLIQSAYRGFEVRKMEPLKKLKQMAEVRKQVAEIRNNILALESTADLQKNDRERDAIGEMIMRLLLKLDTVQGLHSSLRDVRKALVRELVTLQEKLDSLVTKNREATKLAVDPKIGTDSVVGMQEMQNKEAGIIENSVETSGDSSSNTKEQDQSQLSQSAPTECQDTSEPSLTDKKLLGSCENEIRELFVASDMDPPVVVLTSNLQLEEKAVNGAHDGIEVDKTQLEEKNGVHPELEQSLQFPLVTEEKTTSEEIVEAPAMDLCYKPNGLEDRAKVAIHVDDILQASNSRLEEVEQTGKGENKIEDHEMESSMLSDPNLSTDIDKMMATKVEVDKKTVATKESEINMLAELPLGAIEDEPAVSASEELETNLLAELPLGAIEDEPAVFASEELETNLLAELPLGVIEDEPAVSAFGELKQIEARKDEASCHDKMIDNVITNTTALTEAEDLGKVMSEELPVNAAPEEEETQPLSSVAIVGQRDQEMMDVDHAPSLETAVTDVATEESELKREKVWEAEVNEKKEEDVLLDSQCEEAKCIIDRDKVEDKLPNELESSKENVVVATLIPQKSIDEEEIVMGRDKKLVEENAKLRAMMEKLMEAGKEQLTVISNLTGRVKDLERKLSRNQKERIRRSRKTLTKTTKGRGC